MRKPLLAAHAPVLAAVRFRPAAFVIILTSSDLIQTAMSYVGEPFEHDIFVSYSHGDPDGSGESKIRRWSQAFARELESELRAYSTLGPHLKVFLDQHDQPEQGIDPLSPLTEQLKSDISRTAILTVLMSPYYLISRWCADEREWWHTEQMGLSLPAAGRVAIARIWPTAEPWPKEFLDSRGEQPIGFSFTTKPKQNGTPQPFEWPEPKPSSGGAFRKELLDLVGWIALKLDDIRQIADERRRTEVEAAKLTAAAGQLVYLHGRMEFAPLWERAAAALSDAGLVVLPGEPDPVVSDPKESKQIQRNRVETMSVCDAVLLVAPDNGRAVDARTVDADLAVIGHGDRNLARAKSDKLLPCALLDNAGADLATPRRKLTARRLDVEWIDATTQPWTPAVQQWLRSAGSGR